MANDDRLDYGDDRGRVADRRTASVCTDDCRGANACSGFEVCSGCGESICGCMLDENGLCEDCSERKAEEDYDEAVEEYCSACIHFKECERKGDERYDIKKHCSKFPAFKNGDALNEECANFIERKSK